MTTYGVLYKHIPYTTHIFTSLGNRLGVMMESRHRIPRTLFCHRHSKDVRNPRSACENMRGHPQASFRPQLRSTRYKAWHIRQDGNTSYWHYQMLVVTSRQPRFSRRTRARAPSPYYKDKIKVFGACAPVADSGARTRRASSAVLPREQWEDA
jgi:hypothetical protein